MEWHLDEMSFAAACRAVQETGRADQGVGTLGEKTLHAVLKRMIEPNMARHEVKLGRYTADVLNEDFQSVADSVTVSGVEVSDFWGMHVDFTIKGRFALTADNSKDLAKLLAMGDPADPFVAKFAKKYEGKTIEFDGCILNVQNHDGYSTRYDLLIGAGDYNPESSSGPNFQYRGVTVTSLEWKGKTPDAVSEGMNLHFVAKVEEYEEDTELFVLEPVVLKVR